MFLVSDFSTLVPDRPTLLTIGKFDGVHCAHQHLINTLVDRAKAIGAQSAVMTFDPHPDEILRPERQLLYLTSIEERAALIARLGIDLMLVLPFTPSVAQLTAQEFMQQLCDHVTLRELWVGPDFRLGYRAQGTVPVLRELGTKLGYTVEPIPVWRLDGEPVRSTTIRDLLSQGDVLTAAQHLGRRFSIHGTVVQGDQRGRTIGFPTANIQVPPRHVIPGDGVYACRVRTAEGQWHNAVTNIGVRPTFGTLARTVEAHVFDFDGDLYGQPILLTFVERLRGEQRFASIDELVAQIQRDAAQAKILLDNL